MARFQYNLFADSFQFYLQDELADGNLSDAWTDDAVARLLATGPGVVGVGTVRNMTVPVTVEILEQEPEPDAASWDQVTECSLDVSSGRIVIAGYTDHFPDAARIAVPPATYRVRVSYGSLDKLSEDGLKGEDHYRIQLWQGASMRPRALKRRAT